MWLVLFEGGDYNDIIGPFDSYKAAIAWIDSLPESAQDDCYITHPFDEASYKQFIESERES
jgi:hypothetical protein